MNECEITSPAIYQPSLMSMKQVVSIQQTIHDIILDRNIKGNHARQSISSYNANNDHTICIVNLSKIQDQYDQWIQYLPFIQPYYAVKCNPDMVILRLLYKLEVNFDCASKQEIMTILHINSDPSRIIYANPCKMKTHLSYASYMGVNLLTFDNEEELYKIKIQHNNARLLLRIAVDDSQSVCKFNKKFGCKSQDISKLLQLSLSLQLNVIGVSFHLGSGCTSAHHYYKALKDCRNAYNIASSMDIQFSVIDIGGGFPGNNRGIHFSDIAENIQLGINDFFITEYTNKRVYFIAEPGRYFVETSHTLVVRVIGKRESYDLSGNHLFVYYINDGVYGSFNNIIFDHASPILIPLNSDISDSEPVLYRSQVFGPTCDSIDIINDCTFLPELYIDDYLYVENMGAYTLSAASEFNGIEKPEIHYINSCVHDGPEFN